MAVINTNISAIRATNASNSANKMLGTAMERLSTGKRINGANDDAAGLGIVTTMTASIRGMPAGGVIFMVDGAEVSTVESLDTPQKLSPVQEAFIEASAFQRDVCTVL